MTIEQGKNEPTSHENVDIFDLMVSNKQRYTTFLNLDTSQKFEALKRFIDIYRLSGVKRLEKFLINICIFDKSQIDLYLKQEILFILCCKLTQKNKIMIQRSFTNTLFLMVKKAFRCEEYWLMFEENLILYIKTFKDNTVQNLIKNVIILGFKNWVNEPFKKIFSFLCHFNPTDQSGLCPEWFSGESFFMDMCSFILIKYQSKLKVKNILLLLQILFKGENEFKENLFNIIADESIDLNLKLEACDILYLNGSENIKNRVQTILENITPNLAYTDNPENVHLSSVVSSVDKTLESLLNINKGKIAPATIYEILRTKFPKDIRITGSLNRIFNYGFLKFSKFKLSLKEILQQVWLVIDNCDHELKNQLYLRLEQELIDMYDTCSHGYATRLINVLSGFEIKGSSNLGITISYEDEIFAIFSNKINSVVAEAPENIKGILLEELMVPSNDYEHRLNLTRYLRSHLPKIWNEIYHIFENELTITDLDLYCRKVTMRYEGC